MEASTDKDDVVGFIRRIDEAPQFTDSFGDEESLSYPYECAAGYDKHVDAVESDPETDLDDDLVPDVPKPRKSIEDVYIKACEKFKTVACSPFVRKLHNDEIDISHYNIGPNGAKAIAKVIPLNTKTSLLNLSDNGIGADGATAIANALVGQCFITVLDMSMNFINEDGVEAICAMMKRSKYLLELSLASNRLTSASAVFMADALKENRTLRMLNLSSNEFGDENMKEFSSAIATNTGLLHLNLSSNFIRNQCGVGIIDAISRNTTLRYVDLSSNGLADNVSSSLETMLATNTKLRELDISSNRLTGKAAKRIAIGLEKNNGLRVLRIGQNPIRSDGAILIIKMLTACSESQLEELYLNGIDVSMEFDKATNELLEHKSSIYVEYGNVFSGSENRKRAEIQKDLVSRILDFIEFRGIRVMDFFRSMDKTGRLMITIQEFKRGLEAAEIPMRSSQVNKLFKLLDVQNTGYAHYRDFVKFLQKDFYRAFAKTRRNNQWNH